MSPETEFSDPDRALLSRLNREYVAAFMNADVDWYRRHLADEFVVIESDGQVLDKEQFLINTAKGPGVEFAYVHTDEKSYTARFVDPDFQGRRKEKTYAFDLKIEVLGQMVDEV